MRNHAHGLVAGLALALAACGSAPLVSTVPVVTPPASLLPPYLATAQNAQADAQATIAAGQGQMAELAVRATEVALNLTLAAATEQAFVRQTEQAQALTATAVQSAANATATASQESSSATYKAQTQTAASVATQTAEALATRSAEGTATQAAANTATAWPLTQVAIQATQARIVAETEQVRQEAYWRQFVVPFWVFLSVVIAALIVWGLVLAYRRLLPVLDLRLRTLRDAQTGETLLLLDSGQRLNFLQPRRSFGPALLSGPEGVQVSGLAPENELQDRTTARAQAADLARVLPPGQKRAAQKLVQPQPDNVPITEPTDAVVEGHYRVVEPDTVRPWLDDVRAQLLTGPKA